MTGEIHFEKASEKSKDLILAWLREPHVREFWDNSPEHLQDIINFIDRRPQTYFAGTAQYWVAFLENVPYAFIVSDLLLEEQEDLSPLHREHLSINGHTVCLDFCIGNTEYLGKGLAAPTLKNFMDFYRREVDSKVDTYFMDPDENNSRATHVYDKAGFQQVGSFHPTEGAFVGHNNTLMIKKYDAGVL